MLLFKFNYLDKCKILSSLCLNCNLFTNFPFLSWPKILKMCLDNLTKRINDFWGKYFIYYLLLSLTFNEGLLNSNPLQNKSHSEVSRKMKFWNFDLFIESGNWLSVICKHRYRIESNCLLNPLYENCRNMKWHLVKEIKN